MWIADTDQVSVGGWFGFVHSKVLSGHFLGRLAVTDDGQQADKQQSAEQPGAIHGAGPGGGGRKVPAGQEAADQDRRSGGSQQVHRRFCLHPPEPLLSYTDSQSPAREGHQHAGGCWLQGWMFGG